MQLLRGCTQACVPQAGPEPPQVTTAVEILKYSFESGSQRRSTRPPHPVHSTCEAACSVFYSGEMNTKLFVGMGSWPSVFSKFPTVVIRVNFFGHNLLFALSFSTVENESMFIFHLWNIPGRVP